VADYHAPASLFAPLTRVSCGGNAGRRARPPPCTCLAPHSPVPAVEWEKIHVCILEAPSTHRVRGGRRYSVHLEAGSARVNDNEQHRRTAAFRLHQRPDGLTCPKQAASSNRRRVRRIDTLRPKALMQPEGCGPSVYLRSGSTRPVHVVGERYVCFPVAPPPPNPLPPRGRGKKNACYLFPCP
jgi:hypothetical protein